MLGKHVGYWSSFSERYIFFFRSFKILFFGVQGGLQKVLYSYYLLPAETLITNVLLLWCDIVLGGKIMISDMFIVYVVMIAYI